MSKETCVWCGSENIDCTPHISDSGYGDVILYDDTESETGTSPGFHYWCNACAASWSALSGNRAPFVDTYPQWRVRVWSKKFARLSIRLGISYMIDSGKSVEFEPQQLGDAVILRVTHSNLANLTEKQARQANGIAVRWWQEFYSAPNNQ